LQATFEYNRKGEFSIKNTDVNKSRVASSEKWLISDLFIYGNARTYTYHNMIFSTENQDSYIHSDHLDWHRKSQNVLFSAYRVENFLLDADPIQES
jgi:hypothetical protein